MTHRVTKQRAAIIGLLESDTRFLTAQEIYDNLRTDGATIGLATVYRNLQTMAESGEIDSIRTPEGENAYRMCSGQHHHHLVCTGCAKTVELAEEEFESWLQGVAEKHGFTLAAHDIELRGLCPQCS